MMSVMLGVCNSHIQVSWAFIGNIDAPCSTYWPGIHMCQPLTTTHFWVQITQKCKWEHAHVSSHCVTQWAQRHNGYKAICNVNCMANSLTPILLVYMW